MEEAIQACPDAPVAIPLFIRSNFPLIAIVSVGIVLISVAIPLFIRSNFPQYQYGVNDPLCPNGRNPFIHQV